MDYSLIVQALVEQETLPQTDLESFDPTAYSSLADLFEAYVGRGRVTDAKWAEVVAKVYELPLLPEIGSVEPELLQKVPANLAFKRMALPLRKENGSVVVAVTDPEPEQIYEDVRILTGGRVRVEIAPEDVLLQAIQKNYGATVERLAADLGGHSEERDGEAEEIELDHDIGDLREAAGEPTVINLVNLIIFEAVRDRASDIHVEPFEHEMKLRYRIDGILVEQSPPPKHLRLAITSRIKIMAGMNIAERFIPQDGHIRLSVEGRSIDLRVSTCPTVFGESVVMRILDKGSLVLEIEQLGMSLEDQKKFDDVIGRPHGIFLVTGPTGSGKTTTLYTGLTRIFTPKLKIITVEDPVEYQLPGICQIQVNHKRGLSFAEGLRSIVRQDPDVIMVGEIRDKETAEIAIRSALTGHMVFSTLHTNSASGAVPRLIDMGIDPFLVSSSLNGIMAQRLVRRICTECREEYEPTGEEKLLARWQHVNDVKCYRGAGCERCGGTGYRGRLGVYEFILVTDEIRQLFLDKPSAAKIAKTSKVRTFREDGWDKVKSGLTTIEEVLRVSEEE